MPQAVNQNSGRNFHLSPLFFILCLFLLSACESQEKPLTIGLITNNPNGLKNVQGFKDGMTEQGYIEGEHVSYLSEDAPVRGQALRERLRSFVDQRVDLIFTAGTPTGIAAWQATAGTDIPVIFGVIADPVKAGVMSDLTAPGGNLSGVRISRNQALRMELFLRLVPTTRRILIPFNPNDPAATSAVAQLEENTQQLGIEIIKQACPDNDAVVQLLGNFPGDVDAVFLLPDSVVNKHISEFVRISLERKIPVSGPSNTQVEKGALMGYGIIHHDAGYQAARMAHQVLQGVSPASLPVETAESYLGINLATAQAIGVEVPEHLLRQAKVIVRVP